MGGDWIPILLLLMGMGIVVGGILALRLHPFLALILAALAIAALTPGTSLADAGKSVAMGFGIMAGKVGILIAMAAIIGKCLLDSGAADRIVRSALRLVGEKRAPAAFAGSGFLLGIPVFFDTVFYLMIPIGKALAGRTGKNYALYVMTMAAGATIAHSLVPPTPGPLLVAGEIEEAVQKAGGGEVDMVGTMIVMGLLLGGLAVIPGVLYAFWANRRWPIPLRETPDMPLADLQAMSERDDRSLPPLSLSLVPILLPVVLIVGGVVLKAMWSGPGTPSEDGSPLIKTILFLGDKNIALVVSAAFALVVLFKYTGGGRDKLTSAVQTALSSGGVIILITAAGGAFAAVLRATGIGDVIGRLASPETAGIMILPLAFFATTLVRTAQGSATVAMTTAIGMFAALAASLPFHPVYLALAIGFGSKPFPWMNDSGFWVVCRMSGQTERETLRNHSIMFCIMGFTGLILSMIGAAIVPLE